MDILQPRYCTYSCERDHSYLVVSAFEYFRVIHLSTLDTLQKRRY